jgi:hypothetical protein
MCQNGWRKSGKGRNGLRFKRVQGLKRFKVQGSFRFKGFKVQEGLRFKGFKV